MPQPLSRRLILFYLMAFVTAGSFSTGTAFSSTVANASAHPQQNADEPSSTSLAKKDYTFSCWLNGWRKNPNDVSPDIFAIETSHYGFTLNVADFRECHVGSLDRQPSYAEAVQQKTDALRHLPDALLTIEIQVDGITYSANTCAAALAKDARHLSSVRLWESGRFVQHYDLTGLVLTDSAGQTLECDSRLDVMAWSNSLTFNLIVDDKLAPENSALRLGLKSSLGSWKKSVSFQQAKTSNSEYHLSMTCSFDSNAEHSLPKADLSVTKDQKPIPVAFNQQKNCFEAVARRLRRSWQTGYTDIRDYDDFSITVAATKHHKPVPFLLHLTPPANVTGVCPVLCHEDGTPTGIPVQLSKNWHEPSMGSYVMCYAKLPTTNRAAKYVLRFTYGFYGTLPAASHAQLSLIGYSGSAGNGRWDQLAIGCWGESICFDMDMSLVDVAITDIRALMIRHGKAGRKWGWTDAGWGGDWLHIQDAGQKKYFQNNLKTAYISHGPCLTEVRHAGCYGANQEVDFTANIKTLRTDDYCRTFQTFRYTVNRDISASQLSLFMLGRTHHYQTPRLALGNSNGLVNEIKVPATVKKGDAVVDNIPFEGDAPYWVAFVGASETATERTKPNGYRAIVIRSFTAEIGGVIHRRPSLRSVAHKANPANLDIEILPPNAALTLSKGDRIDLEIELITLPREADDYYGPNEWFHNHLSVNAESWETVFREASGNHLNVNVRGGSKLHNYPLVIQAEAREVTATIKGGIGAVPVTFRGLKSETGHHLFQVIDGKRILFDQSTHGNDFWQTDFNFVNESYSVTFNLPLDEFEQSEWVLVQALTE